MADSESAMEGMKTASAPEPESQLTAATVERMVKAMYETDTVDPEAESFLIKAQSSFEAWTFSWELLQLSKCPEVQFFGAKCLQVKVCDSWNTLEPEQHEQLKALLEEKLALYTTPSPVTAKLRQVAAIMAILQKAESKESPSPVEYVWSLYKSQVGQNPQDSNTYSNVLLIVALIPEEASSMYKALKISKTVYMEITSQLQAVSPQVLGWLKSLPDLQTIWGKDQGWEAGMVCLESWLGMRVGMEDLMPLMDNLFCSMHNPARLWTAVRVAHKVFAMESLQRHPQTVCRLLEMLSNLGKLLEFYAQKNEMDVTSGLCELMVDAAEEHSTVLVEMVEKGGTQRDQALSLLESIMRGGFPPGSYQIDEETSTCTLMFWITLKEDLTSSIEEKESEEMRQLMKQIYSRLLQILVSKVQYPAGDCWNSLNKDDRWDIELYRKELCQSMAMCYEVLGADMLRYLCHLLQEIVEESRKAHTVTWQRVEAIFKSLSSVYLGENNPEPWFLSTVMNLLPTSSCNPYLLATINVLIGEYHTWVKNEEGMVERVVPLVLEGLRHAVSANQAISTLDRFLQEPLPQISAHLPSILASAQETLEAEQINNEDCCHLARCVGMVLSHLPVAQMRAHLTPILMPKLGLMHTLLYQQPPSSPAQPSKEVPSKLQHLTRFLSSLLHSISTHSEVTPSEEQELERRRMIHDLMGDIFPLIKDMVKQWKSVSGIIVETCGLLKILQFLLKSQFLGWLDPVVVMLEDVFQDTHDTSVIKLAQQLVQQLQSEASAVPLLVHLINFILQTTLHNIQSLTTYPSFILLFNSCMLDLMKCELMKAESGVNMEVILQIGVTVLKFPMLSVEMSCSSVVRKFLTLCRERQDYYSIVYSNMLFIVTTVMEVILSEPTEDTLQLMADTLTLCVSNSQLLPCFSAALKQCLAQGLPHCSASDKDKEEFVRAIVRYTKSETRLLHAVRDFTFKCQSSARR